MGLGLFPKVSVFLGRNGFFWIGAPPPPIQLKYVQQPHSMFSAKLLYFDAEFDFVGLD